MPVFLFCLYLNLIVIIKNININLMAEHKRRRREAHPACRKGEEILI